jgi:hypothetical protein
MASTISAVLQHSQVGCEQGGVGAKPPRRGFTPAPRSHPIKGIFRYGFDDLRSTIRNFIGAKHG